ncbi:MAG: hypothetical protein R3Y28_06765 [Candidatus Gastranaerophilales bacterium]
MKKFDIRKTFEIFWTEPLSVFTKGLFQLVSIENNIFSQKPAMHVDFVNNQAQITFVNNQKMYNTFQSVLIRHKMKEQKQKVISNGKI